MDVPDIAGWMVDEFSRLLGQERSLNDADWAALSDLAQYPDHIVLQSLDAARQWLRKPGRTPIHSLGRWLVGTARRKLEAQQSRGNSVTALPARKAAGSASAGQPTARTGGR